LLLLLKLMFCIITHNSFSSSLIPVCEYRGILDGFASVVGILGVRIDFRYFDHHDI